MTITLNGAPLDFSADERQDVLDSIQPHCAMCGRCTDHAGEHDGAHLAGLVEYGTVMIDGTEFSDSTVRFTEKAHRLAQDGIDVRRLAHAIDRMAYDRWCPWWQDTPDA
jgi:hypothetical protein